MRVPRNVSPAAARRRALLIDVVLGLLLGCLAIILSAGIGVAAFFALLGALGLAAWFLLDGGLRRVRRRRRG